MIKPLLDAIIDGVRHRLVIQTEGHNTDGQTIVIWFREGIVNDETTPAAAHHRAALAMMGLAQQIYEAAAANLAAFPMPPTKLEAKP